MHEFVITNSRALQHSSTSSSIKQHLTQTFIASQQQPQHSETCQRKVVAMESTAVTGPPGINHIYQYSLINALMDGVCDTGITAATLTQRGNQALGTFTMMRGELMMLDGRIYQLKPNGWVKEVAPETQIPFAMSTMFVPQRSAHIELRDKNDIRAALDAFHGRSKNSFRTYRITGTFEYLKCRTVEGQAYKSQSLREVGQAQSIEIFENVQGTIIGFSSPRNWQGFTVAGEHSHFLRSDCKAGGHVLELRASQITMGTALSRTVHMELPTSEDFNLAELSTDDAGLIAVES